MGSVVPIGDPADPRLDDYRNLNHVEFRIDVETSGSGPKFLIAEGATVVDRLVASGGHVRSVLVTGRRLHRLADVVERVAAPCFVVDPGVLAAVVGFDAHRGVFASADRPPLLTVAEIALRAGLLAVLEGINDHGNLGAVLRSASALGVDGIILDPTCADPFYRRSVRVSMGGVFTLPIARADSWPEALDTLRDAGIRVIAMTGSESAGELPREAVSGPLAVMLGSEAHGLSPAALERADARFRIPMSPSVDSLNVGHAAAIAFWALGGS